MPRAAKKSKSPVDAPAKSLMRVERVPVASLRPHPRNYRKHPPDQLAHIAKSIEEHGFYRNVVAARDGTILAGHGVVQACLQVGITEVPIVRLDVGPDDPRALRLVVGDNEIGNLAEVDDRVLTDMLKELFDHDPLGLLGTGYDEQTMSALAFVTRPASEVDDPKNEWQGMPGYEAVKQPIRLVICFDTEEERDAFKAQSGISLINSATGTMQTTWWPERPRDDPSAVRFVEAERT